MGETFTKSLNAVTNNAQMNDSNVHEKNLDADELMFYHSIRAELDHLKMKPKLQTIHQILDYSKSLR
jgi:hypothetical protein